MLLVENLTATELTKVFSLVEVVKFLGQAGPVAW